MIFVVMESGEMADYIDRQALDVVAFTDRDGTFSDGIQWLLEYIDALPPADAVEVVRCKDCKHLFEDNKCPLRTWWTHTEDDFCSYGERKDG